MMFRALATLVVVVCAIPSGSALDWFPDHARAGDTEARLMVRLPQGGTLEVDASGPVEVAIVEPGAPAVAFASTPFSHHVSLRGPDASWHGLDGTVEIVLRRADARATLDITVRSEGDAGIQWTWPPARDTPAVGVAGAVVVLAGITTARRRNA